MAAQSKGRDFWQAHVEAWRESGLTQRAYCRRHELPEGHLSHWKHRLEKAQRRRSAETQLVPIRMMEESAPRTDRANKRLPRGGDAGGDLALAFGNGLRLEIGNGFHPDTLRRVLEVLGDMG
jgi:hypothetical protein